MADDDDTLAPKAKSQFRFVKLNAYQKKIAEVKEVYQMLEKNHGKLEQLIESMD